RSSGLTASLSVSVEIAASRAKFVAGVVARASRPSVPARFHGAKTRNSQARRPCHYFGCGAGRAALGIPEPAQQKCLLRLKLSQLQRLSEVIGRSLTVV